MKSGCRERIKRQLSSPVLEARLLIGNSTTYMGTYVLHKLHRKRTVIDFDYRVMVKKNTKNKNKQRSALFPHTISIPVLEMAKEKHEKSFSGNEFAF